VARAPRRVRIHDIVIVARDDASVTLDIACTKGTYIRTLAEDLGEALGCGAHLSALRRTATGGLRLDDARTLDGLAALDEASLDTCLRPIDLLLQDRPAVQLAAAEAARFLTGLRRRVAMPDAPSVRVYGPGDGEFLGLAHISAGELIADRLLTPVEVRAQCGGPAPTP
jgi:tRNA pseudouridine55 synthase